MDENVKTYKKGTAEVQVTETRYGNEIEVISGFGVRVCKHFLCFGEVNEPKTLVDLLLKKPIIAGVLSFNSIAGFVLTELSDGWWCVTTHNETIYLGKKNEMFPFFVTDKVISLFLNGDVLQRVAYSEVFINDHNENQLVAKTSDGKYKVWRKDSRGLPERSQADLILTRSKQDEFVLHYNPYKEYFERINITQPHMIKRCDAVFEGSNWMRRNSVAYAAFLAPKSLTDIIYNVWSWLGQKWDEFCRSQY